MDPIIRPAAAMADERVEPQHGVKTLNLQRWVQHADGSYDFSRIRTPYVPPFSIVAKSRQSVNFVRGTTHRLEGEIVFHNQNLILQRERARKLSSIAKNGKYPAGAIYLCFSSPMPSDDMIWL